MVGTPVANRGRARDRGADRLLRQHAGAARRPVGRADGGGAAGAGEGARAGGAAAPGPALRAGGGARPAGAQPGARPLFQVMFAWQNAPAAAPGSPARPAPWPGRRRPARTVARRRAGDGAVRPVADALASAAGGSRAGWRTPPRCSSGRRWSAACGYLRARAGGDGRRTTARPVGAAASCCPAAERQRVLEEWNATEAAYPRGRVHPRAVRGAGRRARPDAVAVVFEDERADATRS